MVKKTCSALLICALSVLGSAGAALADPDPGVQRDWPVWSGPDRNLTSLGNGIFDRESFGLERVWSHPLGSAYSGISIVGDRVVTGFSDGTSDFLVSLDAETGKEHWRYRIEKAYTGHDGSDDGPIATPMIADGHVYGLGAWGSLFALALEDGREIWAHQIVEKLGARKPEYGFTTTPTVVGDLLVVETGGDQGRSISAFERATGKLRWSTGDDAVGYQSPLILESEGKTHILAVTNKNMIALDPATGKVAWQHQHNDGEHDGFSHPVRVGKDGVLLTYWPEAVLYRLADSGAEEVWRSRALRGNYAIPVPYKGHLYGFSGRFLTCVDAATGETVWKSRPPGGGNLVLVDGHLVIQAPSGEVVVAEATPEGYVEKARVQALDRGYYTRPSFAGGRVFVRNLSDVAAVGVTDRVSAAPAESAEPAAGKAQGMLAQLVEKVRAASDDQQQLVDEFLAKHPERPLQEGGYVHFLYQGEVEDLVLGGNFVRDGRDQPMHHLVGTDLYYHSLELPPASHFTYHFAEFDERMSDPGNPHKVGPEGREQSVLTTPGWQPAAHLGEPTGPRGRIEKIEWKSELLGNEREVQVYLPAGYDGGSDRYPLLVVNHGDQALAMGHIDRSLDNLVGQSVAPVIVALVPRRSWPEFAGSQTNDFSEALVSELLPTLDASFRTIAKREARGVIGVGSAGFAALYTAFQQPDQFSKAAAQSFYKGDLHDDLLAMIEKSEGRDMDLLIHWSSFDYKDPNQDLDSQRDAKELVAKLGSKGHSPVVIESTDGAGWGMWQAQTGRILEELYPLR